MSLGGGGYGGGGLPYPEDVLQLWGGKIRQAMIPTPSAPTVVSDDGSDEHQYAIVAVGVQGNRTPVSRATKAKGFARPLWDSAVGADAYVVVRDGNEVAGPLRIEGSQKEWTDNIKP